MRIETRWWEKHVYLFQNETTRKTLALVCLFVDLTSFDIKDREYLNEKAPGPGAGTQD